jgi:hypothetical protein
MIVISASSSILRARAAAWTAADPPITTIRFVLPMMSSLS